ncbi:dCMP_cyt_deam_1 domain-containing protein, partial [Cephalotus follicularis]
AVVVLDINDLTLYHLQPEPPPPSAHLRHHHHLLCAPTNHASSGHGNMNTWKIIHIPDKTPIPPNQQPTVDVFVSVIEPKLANNLIRRLNQIAPLENLRHVKRIQKKCLQGGKNQLLVILCSASEDNEKLNSIPLDVQELINSYRLSAFVTKVCKYAASSKEEWEEQCKLWPTSFHPPTYKIDGISGFSEEDSLSVFSFMKYAVELAKSGDGSIVNSAVIVDPSAKQIIASAYDQVFSRHNPTNKISNGSSCFRQPEVTSSLTGSNGVASQVNLLSNGSPDESKQLCIGASCLNPWLWVEEQLHDSTSVYWHPLRHAALIAIESSAARDRNLFPCSGPNGDKFSEVDHEQSSSRGSPAKRQKTNLIHVENDVEQNAHIEGSCLVSARPYLCTGYDVYLVWEPCTMCAMALVHQRIRRIFYAFPNPNAGGLGSVHRLQGEKSLNHHYAVFRVLLPEEVLNKNETEAGRPANDDQSTT